VVAGKLTTVPTAIALRKRLKTDMALLRKSWREMETSQFPLYSDRSSKQSSPASLAKPLSNVSNVNPAVRANAAR
jgi:hypothetical protein